MKSEYLLIGGTLAVLGYLYYKQNQPEIKKIQTMPDPTRAAKISLIGQFAAAQIQSDTAKQNADIQVQIANFQAANQLKIAQAQSQAAQAAANTSFWGSIVGGVLKLI